jgi:hypothetical protein
MLSNAVYQREIARLLLALDASPRDAEPTTDRLTQLFEDVCHLSDAAFVAACDRCRRELDWFPKAKHILERAPQPPGSTADEAIGSLRRKIMFRYSAETRPTAELDAGEAALVHDLGMTPARLAAMAPKEFDWWLRQTYGPAWAHGIGQQQTTDALLGVGHRPALVGGEER